jgi:hypothetical protein
MCVRKGLCDLDRDIEFIDAGDNGGSTRLQRKPVLSDQVNDRNHGPHINRMVR